MARKLTSDKWLFTATLAARVHQRGDGLQRLGGHGDGAAPRARTITCSSRRPGPCSASCSCRSSCASITGTTASRRSSGRCSGSSRLALVAVLFGRPVNGASRWLLLGPLGVQPSELAKIAVIFCTAALLERRMERIDEIGYSLVPTAAARLPGHRPALQRRVLCRDPDRLEHGRL